MKYLRFKEEAVKRFEKEIDEEGLYYPDLEELLEEILVEFCEENPDFNPVDDTDPLWEGFWEAAKCEVRDYDEEKDLGR